MIALLLVTLIATAVGSIGGALANGFDGFFLGGSAGLVLGVSLWAVGAMNAQWRRERQLDRYFNQGQDLYK